ncbi:MAG: T9SS type A sorting domain-containing protein [Cyclonatronaceae bacterium]
MKIRRSMLKIATTLFVFIITSLFIAQAAVAQIVLTRNSLSAFLNGEYTVTVSASVDTLNILPLLELSGADQTWDFTTLDYDYTFTGSGSSVTLPSVEGTPGEGDEHFEQATHVTRSAVSIGGDFGGDDGELSFTSYEFNILNDDEFLSLGSISLDPDDPEEFEIVLYSRPAEVYYKFPVTYESAWTYEFEEQLISGGFDFTQDYKIDVVVDGWGQLVTPNGTFNVLKITKLEEIDLGFFSMESTDVEFITVDGFPIATIYAEKAFLSDEYDGTTMEATLNVISTGTSNPREITSDLPDRATLHQNYPNPFNPSTIITYDLAEASTVSLDIYTVTGIRVMPVISERAQQAGRHSVSVDASNLASGVYIYQLRTGNQVLTRKMTLIK